VQKSQDAPTVLVRVRLSAGLPRWLREGPYGKAAVAAMQKENIYDKVKDKSVLGENISQTASFVASGSADVGIIALSLGEPESRHT
jgi:ABC-type molybdate transport system substrate-binding protein